MTNYALDDKYVLDDKELNKVDNSLSKYCHAECNEATYEELRFRSFATLWMTNYALDDKYLLDDKLSKVDEIYVVPLSALERIQTYLLTVHLGHQKIRIGKKPSTDLRKNPRGT